MRMGLSNLGGKINEETNLLSFPFKKIQAKGKKFVFLYPEYL